MGPAATFLRLGIIFFMMLLFELLPFCYMSFYVFDRKFHLADRAADLYHTSAYYLGHVCAGGGPPSVLPLVFLTDNITSPISCTEGFYELLRLCIFWVQLWSVIWNNAI